MKTARFIGILTLCLLTVGLGTMLSPVSSLHADLPKQLEFPPIEFEMPDIDTLEFSSGLHGYLMEDHTIPLINVIIMYRTGFPQEDRVGLERIAGWAIRNGGSVLYPKDVIDDELEFVGASIESDAGSQVDDLPAAVLGGMQSIPGAICGGLVIGVTESLSGLYLPPGWKDVAAYIILILVLIIRPEGLFGIRAKKKV